MQDILEICCGLDVHKKTVVACIIKSRPSDNLGVNSDKSTTKEIRTFSTLLGDLNSLKSWLEEENCHHVAMESTGIYWVPIYEVLETAFNGNIELLVTNARHMKNVPGKKTDIKDSEWIATLLRAGLLRASFIPPEEIRELRELTRYRKNIVEDMSSQKNRIEKFLQSHGFKFSNFLTDVFGVSGRALLSILVKKGFVTESDIKNELRGVAKAKADDLKLAINGKLNNHQKKLLKTQLEFLDRINAHLITIEESIEEASGRFNEQIELLITIPGIGLTAAKSIIGEIGIDMSKFPTAEHFCSWAGLSPGENESAGKKKVHV
jgi:transposase